MTYKSTTLFFSTIFAVCVSIWATYGWAQTAAPQKQAVTPAAATAPRTPGPPNAAAEKALIDQYCVVCHNDKAKRANLSLQNQDLTAIDKNPELWERVIRKLRAGMMPPPGMRRPQIGRAHV